MESRRWPIERAIHYHRTLGGEILHVTVSSRLGGYISITSRSYLGYISAVTSNRLGGYISDAGRVHLPRAEILLRAVAAHEEEIFTRRRKREEGRERNEVRHTPDYHAVHVDARALITLYTWTHARSSRCTRGRTRVHHARPCNACVAGYARPPCHAMVLCAARGRRRDARRRERL